MYYLIKQIIPNIFEQHVHSKPFHALGSSIKIVLGCSMYIAPLSDFCFRDKYFSYWL